MEFEKSFKIVINPFVHGRHLSLSGDKEDSSGGLGWFHLNAPVLLLKYFLEGHLFVGVCWVRDSYLEAQGQEWSPQCL